MRVKGCSSMISQEIEALILRKQDIDVYLQNNQPEHHLSQLHLKHQSLQSHIHRINSQIQNLNSEAQQLQSSHTHLQNEIVSTVMCLESIRIQIQINKPEIINFFQLQEPIIVKIRIRLIEQEYILEQIAQIPIRRHAIVFLKKQLKQFNEPNELEICRLNQIQQFEHYVQEKQTFNLIQNQHWVDYINLLKQARQSYINNENLMHQVQDLTKIDSVMKSISHSRQLRRQCQKKILFVKSLKQQQASLETELLKIKAKLQDNLQRKKQLEQKYQQVNIKMEKRNTEKLQKQSFIKEINQIEEAIKYLRNKQTTLKENTGLPITQGQMRPIQLFTTKSQHLRDLNELSSQNLNILNRVNLKSDVWSGVLKSDVWSSVLKSPEKNMNDLLGSKRMRSPAWK